MYYRKKYSGTIANFTDKRTVTAINGTTTVSIFKNQTDIVGAAIEDILHDVGYPDARFDEETSMIYFDADDENGIFFAYVASMQMGFRIRNGSSWAAYTCTSGAGYQPFNTSYTNYSFYITIIGEPKAYFVMCFGNYATPTSISVSMLHVAFGKNVITDQDMIGITTSTSWSAISSMYFTTKKEFGTAAITTSFASSVTGLAENLVLIRKYTATGYIFFNDVYFANTAAHTYGQLIFMELNGVTYWCPSTYLLVKCTTELEV